MYRLQRVTRVIAIATCMIQTNRTRLQANCNAKIVTRNKIQPNVQVTKSYKGYSYSYMHDTNKPAAAQLLCSTVELAIYIHAAAWKLKPGRSYPAPSVAMVSYIVSHTVFSGLVAWVYIWLPNEYTIISFVISFDIHALTQQEKLLS